jgi:hypothetical protein
MEVSSPVVAHPKALRSTLSPLGGFFLLHDFFPYGIFALRKKMCYVFLRRVDFPEGKTMRYRKTSESEMLSRLEVGTPLLPPLVVTDRKYLEKEGCGDARIQARLPEGTESFHFVVEAKSQSTPMAVRNALAEVRACAAPDDLPMIMVPYLSPERLADLEREKVSGVDLCGNGVVIVLGRLYVLRTGQPNCYPDSRPLSNPYRGRSAMVARMLLSHPRWGSLGALQGAVREAGAELSLSQTSKAVGAMQEDLLLSKSAGTIVLQEPLRLLDQLGAAWKNLPLRGGLPLRLPPETDWAGALSAEPRLKWAVTGESSVARYTVFSQGGPRRIAVSDLPLAQALLGGTPESVPNFADVELVETEEAGFFFGNEVDEKGIRWASRLQAWLELQAGDGRQRDAAKDIRSQIIEETKP